MVDIYIKLTDIQNFAVSFMKTVTSSAQNLIINRLSTSPCLSNFGWSDFMNAAADDPNSKSIGVYDRKPRPQCKTDAILIGKASLGCFGQDALASILEAVAAHHNDTIALDSSYIINQYLDDRKSIPSPHPKDSFAEKLVRRTIKTHWAVRGTEWPLGMKLNGFY